MNDTDGSDYGLVPSRRVTRRARRRPPLAVDTEPLDSQESVLKSLSASAAALAAEVRELRALVATLTDKVERLDQRIASGPATEKLRPPARRTKTTVPTKTTEPAKTTVPAKTAKTARPRARAKESPEAQ